VRIVVRTAERDVYEADVEIAQELEQGDRLGKVDLNRIVLIDAKPEYIGQEAGKLVRHTRSQGAGRRRYRIGPERHEIDCAQPDTDHQARDHCANPFDDLAQKARAILETAAVAARARARAQKFMPEIAVAMLDIDEIVAAVSGSFRSEHVVLDEATDLFVAHDRAIRRIAELPVENGMMIRNPGFKLSVVVRLAEAPRMRELQADDQPGVITGSLLVGFDERLAQAGNGGLGLPRHANLIGVGAPVGSDGNRLSAPDEFGSAQTEPPPAPFRVWARRAVALTVPAFHRVDGETSANSQPGHLDGSG
jgi:hypothetical protein